MNQEKKRFPSYSSSVSKKSSKNVSSLASNSTGAISFSLICLITVSCFLWIGAVPKMSSAVNGLCFTTVVGFDTGVVGAAIKSGFATSFVGPSVNF